MLDRLNREAKTLPLPATMNEQPITAPAPDRPRVARAPRPVRPTVPQRADVLAEILTPLREIKAALPMIDIGVAS